ncbi:flagellin [Fodinicurvata halophila]|uniref:Flagellin n=1 Tax=Fodinicurvata halophila TaxID=1419723 RepID=A0ABV8UL01_9PROT
MSVMNSINTNSGAMIALQNLNSTNSELASVQNRVSTGLRVASAQDDGASFAIAQGLRSDVKGIGAVNEQISKAKGLVSTTISSLSSVSDGLGDIRETLTKMADENNSAEQFDQYKADYDSQLAELQNYVDNAEYNGTNLIDAGGADVNVIADSGGTQYTLAAVDIDAQLAGISDPVDAATAQGLIDGGTDTSFHDAVGAVNDALNTFAGDDRRLTGQMEFNSKLSDAIEEGLGATVDADLAKESARLQSLQIKQQLGTQTLGIANQSPQILLSLFG